MTSYVLWRKRVPVNGFELGIDVLWRQGVPVNGFELGVDVLWRQRVTVNGFELGVDALWRQWISVNGFELGVDVGKPPEVVLIDVGEEIGVDGGQSYVALREILVKILSQVWTLIKNISVN